MTTKAPHLRELGDFLKTRRSELTPEDVGLPVFDFGPRRVKGLRREEVARLAAISTDYYTRVEQGRLAPTTPVLAGLLRALRLDREQGAYLESLLAESARQPARRPRHPQARPQLRRLVEQLTDIPAVVFGPRLDVLAWNPLAAALITDFSAIPAERRNYVRMVFTDPAMRTLYADWESVARTCVAILRMDTAGNPTDPALATLVGDLSISDARFRQWWAARHVAQQTFGTKTLQHPLVGEITFSWDSFRYSGDPEQQLTLWTTEAGSVSHQRLQELAALSRST
ncbi:XRE family transcriptional regulator [Arthrobacter sp. SW1]|uniref:helix-turn-helix domain-containing protein n=1 Tax=Arthrobacter sp. SW1 TaxID=1920889 RepID=UPI000877D5FA|nr:helix-turn-helix transcriptional regulator [Arthrobacter sp. SW1]OFI38508.1 XRE family transcriptional regulator [Arthrobacter sp. SW1]